MVLLSAMYCYVESIPTWYLVFVVPIHPRSLQARQLRLCLATRTPSASISSRAQSAVLLLLRRMVSNARVRGHRLATIWCNVSGNVCHSVVNAKAAMIQRVRVNRRICLCCLSADRAAASHCSRWRRSCWHGGVLRRWDERGAMDPSLWASIYRPHPAFLAHVICSCPV